jgi:hypothetical protein
MGGDDNASELVLVPLKKIWKMFWIVVLVYLPIGEKMLKDFIEIGLCILAMIIMTIVVIRVWQIFI